MLSPMKKMLSKYKILVVHVNNDLNCVVATKINLKYLHEIEVIMGLTSTMPMLKEIHALIKFTQAYDTLCDLVIVLKLCCAKLCKLYFDPKTKYEQEYFKAFLHLHDCNND